MNKLEQVEYKIKVSNPEILTKFSPTGEFLLLTDKFGTKVVVTYSKGRLCLCGVGENKYFQKLFDSYRCFTNENDSNYLYEIITIFDNSARYDCNKVNLPFGKRFLDNDSLESFIDDLDVESYKKELEDSFDSKQLLFGRWKLDKTQKRDTVYLDSLYSKSIKLGNVDFSTSKHDLLFAWYVLTNKLSKDFNLVEELECFYKFLDDDRAKQLQILKKDWNFTL